MGQIVSLHRQPHHVVNEKTVLSHVRFNASNITKIKHDHVHFVHFHVPQITSISTFHRQDEQMWQLQQNYIH